MQNDKIKSIGELLVASSEAPYKFIVPSYQRGYRWDERQVSDLLNDIWEFVSNKNSGEFYCLQPLIVKKNSDKNYVLVDGQQRLTTILLILKFLSSQNEYDFKFFEISYSTREYSDEILGKISQSQELDTKTADSFYITKAFCTIREWFTNKKISRHKFFEAISGVDDKKVKVIWHELQEDENERQVFSRINSGKIPLTNAELIKAIFLNDTKDNEEVSRIELAKEWDEMEYFLQNDSVWGFLTKDKNYATRIEILFEIYCNKEKSSDEYEIYRDFIKHLEERNINEIWLEIKKIFLTFRFWYENHKLYHLIGFLIATKSKSLSELYDLANKNSKTQFEIELKKEAKKQRNV
ncbi:DUF262 domain-containing protein [Campylobacter majalis]|uniref:DUF262 domain-containing protein n=1 Tax=Campylobacter majalis TaxID=2790656 RepID=UPI003D68094F